MLVNFFFFSGVAILNGETPFIFFYVKLLEGLSEIVRFLYLHLRIFFLYIFHFIFLYHKLYFLFLSLNPKK